MSSSLFCCCQVVLEQPAEQRMLCSTGPVLLDCCELEVDAADDGRPLSPMSTVVLACCVSIGGMVDAPAEVGLRVSS